MKLALFVSIILFTAFKLSLSIFFTHIEDKEDDEEDLLGIVINHEDMRKIARDVYGFVINSETDEEPSFPLHGIVYGYKHRVIFPMIIQHEQIRIKTMVLFDTSFPHVYLNINETLNSLGTGGKKLDEMMYNMNMFVHGQWITISSSRNERFKEINVVGQSFLFEGDKKLELTVSGGSKTAQLSIDQFQRNR